MMFVDNYDVCAYRVCCSIAMICHGFESPHPTKWPRPQVGEEETKNTFQSKYVYHVPQEVMWSSGQCPCL